MEYTCLLHACRERRKVGEHMQVQMTERDKRLIVILALIVIVVGFGWWGIRPALKNIMKMGTELEEQQELMQVNDTKLSKLFMYESEAESYKEMMIGEKKNYFPMMSSNEIDRLFTNMVLDRGLSAYDLSIRTGKTPVAVEPYQYSALAQVVAEEAERIKNEGSSLDGSSSEGDPFEYSSSPAYNSEIYGVDVSMRIAGDMEELKQLIEDISKSEKLLLVRNCVWTEQVSMVNTYDAESEEHVPMMESTTVLNINITLYMCDQSE